MYARGTWKCRLSLWTGASTVHSQRGDSDGTASPSKIWLMRPAVDPIDWCLRCARHQACSLVCSTAHHVSRASPNASKSVCDDIFSADCCFSAISHGVAVKLVSLHSNVVDRNRISNVRCLVGLNSTTLRRSWLPAIVTWRCLRC